MRLYPATSVLCVIDVQERLLPTLPDADRVIARCGRLAEAARLLGIAAILTEQYRKGLGPTAPALAAVLPPPLDKMAFSCCGSDAFTRSIPPGIGSIVLCGIETHICVAQTALDLLARGFAVFVAVDAVASRHTIDHDVALRRLESGGAILTTTEAVLFEWCRTAEHPQFQAVRKLVL
ncbi:MAG: isochorismatase family protein [Planctomycetia bacterium]|nr:isochorismatase family protein [Planctomycetia bacterium]